MEGGPPIFRQDCTCPALLEDTVCRFPVRGCHPLRPAFPGASGTENHATGLFRVRSPLLAESRLMSVPPATEMFQFAGFASSSYEFRRGYPLPGGLPHSEIPGSPIARISPGLFAACHVLHRLSVPRHPPDALTLRLIPGVSAAEHPSGNAAQNRRAQGQNPYAQRPHMKTLLRTHPARLRRARPPRSHDKLSLHPSNNTRRAGWPRTAISQIFSKRRIGGRWCPRMVEVNGFEPMTSCLQSRRSPS